MHLLLVLAVLFQAKAIHIGATLETRCFVHSLLFDKLIARVGAEGSPGVIPDTHSGQAITWPAAGSNFAAAHSGPLATVINNTLVSTSSASSRPQSSQAVVAAPSAASSCNNHTNVQQPGPSHQGWLAGLSVPAVVMLVWTVAGRALQTAVVVVVFMKDLAVQLLMLRAVTTATQGIKAAGAAAAAAVEADPKTPRSPWLLATQLPKQKQQRPQHIRPLATSAPAASGSLGLPSVHPIAGSLPQHNQARAKQQQQQEQEHRSRGAQQQPPQQQLCCSQNGPLQQRPSSSSCADEQCIQQGHAAGPLRLISSSGAKSYKAGSSSLLYGLWAPEEALPAFAG
jgi:hypothetical protein